MLIYYIWTIIKLDIPFDLYHKIKNKRIVGNGRNIAGVFSWIFIALFIGILQERAIESLYLGIGASVGCITSSITKRRLNIKRGEYAFFIDQTDFILGSSLFYITQFNLEWQIFLGGIFLALILHHLINLLRTSWENFVKKMKTTENH